MITTRNRRVRGNRIVLLALAGILAGCTHSASKTESPVFPGFEIQDAKLGGDRKTRIFNERQLAAFRALDYAEARSGTLTRLAASSRSAGAFHGYRVGQDYLHTAAPWRPLDAAAQQTLSGLARRYLRQGVASYTGAGSDYVLPTLPTYCVPRPGFAVRLETDRGTREFAVCLECAYIKVYGPRGQSVDFWIERGELDALKASLGAASPPP